MSKFLTISPFRIIGQLEGFIMKDGVTIQYIRIRVTSREFWVEIPKNLESHLDSNISPGAWLEVQGTKETKRRKGIFKLKAESITTLTPPQDPCVMILSEKVSKKTILVCQENRCCKRGGKNLHQHIKAKLIELDLINQVEIRETECLKQCSKGPNLVVLPDQLQYNQVSIRQINDLLERHLT